MLMFRSPLRLYLDCKTTNHKYREIKIHKKNKDEHNKDQNY